MRQPRPVKQLNTNSCEGWKAKKGLLQAPLWDEVIPHFPKVKSALHQKSSQCPQCWKSVLPPQDGSTRVPQARWCPAPGSCAAPKYTTHTKKQTTVEMWVVESCAGACMPSNTWITAWFPIIFMIFKADIQQQITRLFMSTFQLLRSETSLPQLRCLRSRREPVRWLPDRGSRWTPRTPAAKGSHVEWWWLHIVRQILNSAFHCVSTPAFFDFSNVM